jgi:proline iminopeptidase
MSPQAKLAQWDRVSHLQRIAVPPLVIAASHDTMDPSHMEMMAGLLPPGRYLHCPTGGHLAIYDDQETYFAGLIGSLRDLP